VKETQIVESVAEAIDVNPEEITEKLEQVEDDIAEKLGPSSVVVLMEDGDVQTKAPRIELEEID